MPKSNSFQNFEKALDDLLKTFKEIDALNYKTEILYLTLSYLIDEMPSVEIEEAKSLLEKNNLSSERYINGIEK